MINSTPQACTDWKNDITECHLNLSKNKIIEFQPLTIIVPKFSNHDIPRYHCQFISFHLVQPECQAVEAGCWVTQSRPCPAKAVASINEGSSKYRIPDGYRDTIFKHFKFSHSYISYFFFKLCHCIYFIVPVVVTVTITVTLWFNFFWNYATVFIL